MSDLQQPNRERFRVVLDQKLLNRSTRLVTILTKNGFYSHGEVTYTSSLDRNTLPNCPECRGVPRQNEIHVDYYDKHKDGRHREYEKWVSAKIEYMEDDSTFFDKAMPVLVWLRRNLIGI